MSYDVIIKFETLEEDSQYLIEQCGLQVILISHQCYSLETYNNIT